MSNPAQETFLTWLRDAHALESKLIPELKAHAEQAAAHPDIQRKILQHLAETERHAEIVQALLHEVGGDVSTLKAAMGQATAAVMGMGTGLADDAIVKNALAEFTMEHTEIASYISLIAAAEHLRLPGAVERLRAILREEELMADWLRNQIGRVTIHYLQTEGAPVHA